MGTVWPSPILISFRTPAEGEGISASTLSVEISKSGSSRSTLSPGFLSHLVIVPSKMLSPIWGMTTSTAMGYLSLPRETRGPAEGRGALASKEADLFSLQRKRWPEKARQIRDFWRRSSGPGGIRPFVGSGWLENSADEIDFLLTIRLAIGAEDFVEPHRELVADVGVLPGIPRIIRLRFSGDQSPVDRRDVFLFGQRENCLKGTSGGPGHIFGAQ